LESCNRVTFQVNSGKLVFAQHDSLSIVYIICIRTFLDCLFTYFVPPIISIYLSLRIWHYRRLSEKRNSSVDKTSGKHVFYTFDERLFLGSIKSDQKTSINRASFGSFFFLALLNVKFLICNCLQMLLVSLRWFSDYLAIDNRTLELCKEMGLVVLVVHSSTNWIMFRKVKRVS
jgi:hypothetical protein